MCISDLKEVIQLIVEKQGDFKISSFKDVINILIMEKDDNSGLTFTIEEIKENSSFSFEEIGKHIDFLHLQGLIEFNGTSLGLILDEKVIKILESKSIIEFYN